MYTQNQIATVFGGTGFLGQYIVKELISRGYQVRIVSRLPERGVGIKTAGTVGQTDVVTGNIRDDKSVARCVRNSDVVVNCVGILYPRGKQQFDAIHAQAAERIASASTAGGVKRLIHISALAVDHAEQSKYARSKLAGEEAVKAAFPDATILRPSVLFGAEDNFFNQFANMARFLPFLPLIGGGATKFQPVYVGDVAKAVVNALERSETLGKTYELGGPKIYSFKEVLEYILQVTNRCNRLINLPYPVAAFQGAILEHLPKPLLTRDQVRLLKTDNVVRKKKFTLEALGVSPKSVEEIVPNYLSRFRRTA